MAWKRQGLFPPGTLPQLQAGAGWDLEEKGLAQRHEKYVVNTIDFIRFSPRIKQAHPTLANLYLTAIKGNEGTLGLTEYDAIWEGPSFDPLTDPPPPVYYLNGQRFSAPIDSHPKFLNLVVGAGGDGVGKAMFDDLGKFQGFGKNCDNPELCGLSTFDDTALIWRTEFISKVNKRSYFLPKMQKICNPMGNPPQLPNGRNWKLADFTERDIGDSFFDYSGTWEASIEGGWNKVIYGSYVYAAA